MTTLLWFKRDLRVTDHAALIAAVKLGDPIVPLYVLEPEYWSLPDTSERQFSFLAEALVSLKTELQKLGADLVFRVGSVTDIFDEVRRDAHVTRIISHEETGNAWTFARDQKVAAWARANGVAWHEYPNSAVVRRLDNRDRWASLRDGVMGAPTMPKPAYINAVDLPSDSIPTRSELAIKQDSCFARQRGGRREAQALLTSFLQERGQTYRSGMSSPLTGAEVCSRLSPHIALGTVSVREVVQQTAARQRDVRGTGTGWGGSLKSFQSRLAWRDHFIQKLEDEPEIEFRAMHPAFERARPTVPDKVRLEAWQNGETGFPFVDACMRSLNATGWLNFRMRSMLMSFASYHLWLDWRSTGQHLARQFTDYEPGIHWSQCQMQSGTTGINTLRIYNPVKQGLDQDPLGRFVRKWCPELRDVPDNFLQEPWQWESASGLLGRRYPDRIVDLTEAGREARAKMSAIRRQTGFREASAEVIRKHASRKDRGNNFVNDRAPRRKRTPQDERQLKLDI